MPINSLYIMDDSMTCHAYESLRGNPTLCIVPGLKPHSFSIKINRKSHFCFIIDLHAITIAQVQTLDLRSMTILQTVERTIHYSNL